MATITFKGKATKTCGDLPRVGSMAPVFSLTGSDLTEITPASFKGKRVLLNIFPSIDTPVCAKSVRKFNESAAKMPNTVVLCVSLDLPFAQSRFCAAEGIENVKTASEFRDRSFGDTYGVRISEGPLRGLFSRAVLLIDEQGKVKYAEQVPEIASEPNYDAALNALR